MDTGQVMTGFSVLLGAVIWLIRLEGRVNTHDREHRTHRERVEELREDLAYIRARIDNALSGKH